MARFRFAKAFAGICIFSLLFAQGCATAPNISAPLSEELRGSLGTVGVISVGPPPAPEALGPIGWREEGQESAGRGAIIGGAAGAGAGVGLGLAVAVAFPVLFPAVALLALIGGVGGGAIGAVTGAVIGSATALPTDTAADLETALMEALADYDVRAELTERVLARSTASSETEVIDLGLADTSATDATPDYEPFAARGVDTVLEIGIAQIALTRGDDDGTVFALLINVYARLIGVSDNEVLWSNPQIALISPAVDLSVWTAPGSDHLRTEIDNGLDRLAQRIHNQVFSAT